MHHRADELCFLLLRGQTDLKPLLIFGSRRIVWRGRNVTFYILGVSHAVSLEAHNRMPVLELLSCAPVTGGGEVLATTRVLEPSIVSTIVDDLSYRCELQPFALETWTDRFGESYAASDQLRVAYEPETEDLLPLTCVAWRLGDELTIETVHTYPREGRGIRSRSRIALLPDAT